MRVRTLLLSAILIDRVRGSAFSLCGFKTSSFSRLSCEVVTTRFQGTSTRNPGCNQFRRGNDSSLPWLLQRAHHTLRAESYTRRSLVCRAATPREGTAGDAGVAVRLVSYNIHGWRDALHNDNFARVTAVLRQLRPDVVCLQEVLHPYSLPPEKAEAREYLQQVRAGKGKGVRTREPAHPYLCRLAEETNLPHVSFAEAIDDGYFGAVGFGNAILSHFPIVAKTSAVVVPEDRHQLNRRIEAERRSILVAKLLTGEGSTHVFAVTHIDQLSDDLRTEQLQAMLPVAAGVGPHVLCGDLNMFQRADCSEQEWAAILADAESKGWDAPPEATRAAEELARRGYQDCFYLSDNHVLGKAGVRGELSFDHSSEDTLRPGPTIWPHHPLLRIDFALLSGGWVPGSVKVRQYQRVLTDASDHFPLVVDLQLPP